MLFFKRKAASSAYFFNRKAYTKVPLFYTDYDGKNL